MLEHGDGNRIRRRSGWRRELSLRDQRRPDLNNPQASRSIRDRKDRKHNSRQGARGKWVCPTWMF